MALGGLTVGIFQSSPSILGLGLSSTTAGLIVLGLVVLAIILVIIFRKFIVNSILGILALFALNYFGLKISITVVNVILCGVLGLAGVGLLIVLKLLGVPV